MRLLLLFLASLCCPKWCFAQTDSLWQLAIEDTIFVDGQAAQQLGLGQHQLKLNTNDLLNYQGQQLSQVLANESSLFVKNYGPSGISTLSGRGGGASHTGVLWEGFDVQNPMLGQSDISLIPISFVDEIVVQYGGNSALSGNGNIGGAVQLSSKSLFGQGWQAQLGMQVGSFERWSQQLQLNYSNTWSSTSIRAFHTQAKNNYPFKDVNVFGFPKPIRYQQNAALRQWGLLLDQVFRLQQHQFGLKGWYQHSQRQIPPNLLISSSSEQQMDRSLRLLAHWRWTTKAGIWSAKSAFFDEVLHFLSPTVDAWSWTQSSRNQLGYQRYWGENHRLDAGLNYAFFRAQSDGYEQVPEQHRLAAFLAYRWQASNKKWQASAKVRAAMIDSQWLFPALALGSVWQLPLNLELYTQLSYNYRLPTFNDLYWNVLGNPNLQPEYSWNSELGLRWVWESPQQQLDLEATGFANLVDNWILWSPNPSGVWRPANIQQVWARGLEAQAAWQYQWKAWQLHLKANYAYTLSMATQAINPSQVRKQLIYTPIHQLNSSIGLSFKGFNLQYQHNFTSQRFTTNDHLAALPSFDLGNLRLTKVWTLPKQILTAQAQIFNIWGADYQIVAQRPMPWQQFEVGLIVRSR